MKLSLIWNISCCRWRNLYQHLLQLRTLYLTLYYLYEIGFIWAHEIHEETLQIYSPSATISGHMSTLHYSFWYFLIIFVYVYFLCLFHAIVLSWLWTVYAFCQNKRMYCSILFGISVNYTWRSRTCLLVISGSQTRLDISRALLKKACIRPNCIFGASIQLC